MYEVQEWCLFGGWTNHWTVTENGVQTLQYFNTYEEAEAELHAYLKDMQDEVDAGNMEDAPDIEEFRIEEVI